MHILIPHQFRRNTMTKKVKQNKVIFFLKFLKIPTKRIYLTRSSCHQILFIPVDSLESVYCVTLNIFRTDRRNQFLNSCCHVMLGSIPLRIIAHTTHFISLTNQCSSHLKAYSTATAFPAYSSILTPSSKTLDTRSFQRQLFM